MLIGRNKEREELLGLLDKDESQFCAVYGRRRVGKSSLVEEFARRSKVRFIKLEGIAPGENVDNETQLAAFSRQLNEQCGVSFPVPENWFEAFSLLDKALPKRARAVVLLDEISWMGKYDHRFPAKLKVAWDNLFR